MLVSINLIPTIYPARHRNTLLSIPSFLYGVVQDN